MPYDRCIPADILSKVKWMTLPLPNVSRARNSGFLSASCEVILFLDDDMMPGTDYIEIGLNLARRFPQAQIAARCTDGSGTDQLDEVVRQELFCPGGNFFISAREFLNLGGFDENLFRFGEDAEFSHRAKLAGLRSLSSSALRIREVHRPIGGVWASSELGSMFFAARDLVCQSCYFAVRVSSSPILAMYRVMRQEMFRPHRLKGLRLSLRVVFLLFWIPLGLVYSVKTPAYLVR